MYCVLLILFVGSFNEIIEGDAVIVCKLYCRPERKLTFATLVALVNS